MRYLVLILLSPILFAASGPGKVISAGKGWQADDHLVTRSKAVEAKSMLKGTSQEAELILECQRGWVQYRCESGTCQFPPCINQKDAASYKGKIKVDDLDFRAKLADFLFVREPNEVKTLGVRAGGNPSDAPLLQDTQGVHWGPALNRVLEGHYCLRLSPLPSGAARVLIIDWDRSVDPEGTVQAPNLTPGVYSLEKGTPAGAACTIDPDSVPAWVVILPQSRYAAASATWKTESPRITEVERSDVGPSAAAILRHAVIASLFDAPSGK